MVCCHIIMECDLLGFRLVNLFFRSIFKSALSVIFFHRGIRQKKGQEVLRYGLPKEKGKKTKYEVIFGIFIG